MCPTSGDIFVPLSDFYCTYHGTDSARTAAGLSPLLVCPLWNSLMDFVRNRNATEATLRLSFRTLL